LKKRVAIIGAGPGGLTAGMLLAHHGFQVDIFEKNEHVGGRNSQLQLGDFRFDLGPTFLMLPSILHEMFQFAGRKVSDYLDMREIEPLYRLRFQGKKDFYPSRDREYMDRQIRDLFPGDEDNYRRFMEVEKIKFEQLFSCLKLPYFSILHYLRPQLIRAIPRLDLTQSLYDKLAGYFSHEEMRIGMSFQSKYLGMSPWDCPAAFTIISYIEHSQGISHPIGGLNRISHAMAQVIKEDGGSIHLNRTVKQVINEGGRATGLLLESGERVAADYIIINADFAYSMSNLIDPMDRHKYTDQDLDRRDYSCSTFMLYLGLDKLYDISHHNIIFADDYRRNLEEISVTRILSEDPSFYLQNACKTDPTLAPPGKSTIYVLVPVANNSSRIDWEKEKAAYRDHIIEKIKQKTELKDIEQHIEVEKVITPYDWEHEYNVYRGATFNLSHKLTQMLYLRPHNIFEELKNCFLVGGGTHPGSGLPTIYESARISANIIRQKGEIGLAFDYQDWFDKDPGTGS
jgi:phytoene desaturase